MTLGSNNGQLNSSTRDVFSTLPPELLLKIYKEPSLLSPASIGISRVHRPYATANAYHSVLITGADVVGTLAAFGETMRMNPGLGGLVERFEVREGREREKAYSEGQAPGWLEGCFVDAFEAMVNVKTIVVYRKGVEEVLTRRVLETKAWDSVRKLIVHSPDPIPYASLAHIHLARSLRELEIRSPMQRLIGRPSGLFLPSSSPITTLHIFTEPHTSEFTPFFTHLPSLLHLHLRSSSTDLSLIARSLPHSTRTTLQSLSFSAVGYHNLNIDSAFLGFSSLQYLDLWTPFQITPSFLSSLALLPLVSVVLHGPRNPYLVHMIDFFQSGEAPPSLDHWGFDFTYSQSRGVGVECEGTVGWDVKRERERDGGVRELVDACRRCGVTLLGSIRDAIEPYEMV